MTKNREVKVALCECGWEREQSGYITWGEYTTCPKCESEVMTTWIEQIPLKVALCTCVYNRNDYFREYLRSVVDQTFKDFTLYVWDDGSEEDTKGVIGEFKDKIDIKVEYAEPIHNIGTVKNKVINMALQDNPTYIQITDCDDLLEPTFLEKMVEEIEKGYDFVVCDGVTFGEDSNPIQNNETDEEKIEHGNPFLSWIMMTRETAKEHNYREGLNNYEDWDLHIRLIKAGKEYGMVNEPLYNYRTHPDQFHKVTEKNEWKHRLNVWQLNDINIV